MAVTCSPPADRRIGPAVIATDWGGRLGVDLIHNLDLDDTRRRTIWGRAGQVIVEPAAGPIEVMVADDDALMVSLLGEDGFDPLPDTGTSAWMQADQRPPASVPPDGYRLLDRTRLMDRPHHFADRNGPLVETRLGQTSLYDPTLDLAMVDRTGQPVSYGLFWYDETTRVGFVEPLGTNDGHRRLGLARHVLTAGVDRLARAGATRIKINWENGNRSAIRIYTEIGFEPTTTTSIFTRAAPAG